MHREERQVEADEHQHELDLAEALVEHPAGHLREPVVQPGEHAEHRAAEQHVVEVGDHPVRVLEREVDRDGGAERAVDAADQEHRQEPDREQQRRRERQLAAEQGEDPVEHLHAGRDGDEERHQAEERQVDRAGREHVVGPDREAEGPDAGRREHERLVAEQRLAAEDGQDLADHAHRRQDHDVDGRVRVEPEHVLPEDRVAAGRRVEEVAAVVAVDEQHDQGAREDRRRHQRRGRSSRASSRRRSASGTSSSRAPAS